MIGTKSIQPLQTRYMMQRLCEKYYEERYDDKDHERTPELIGCFEEPIDKDPVEQTENHESSTKGKEIGIHQCVAGIYGTPGENRHPQDDSQCHQCKRTDFDQTYKQISSFDHVFLGNRKQSGKHNVICLSGSLETLKYTQCHKKCSAEYGIARDKKHQAKQDKQVREHGGTEFHFFQQNTLSYS